MLFVVGGNVWLIWRVRRKFDRLFREVVDCTVVVEEVRTRRGLGIADQAIGNCVPCILQEGDEHTSRVALPLAGGQLLIVDPSGDSDLVVPFKVMKSQPFSMVFGVKTFVVLTRDVDYQGDARWKLFLQFSSESAAVLGLT